MEAVVRSVTASFHELVEKAPYLPGELLGAALNIDEPLHLAYFIAHYVGNEGTITTQCTAETASSS